MLSTYICGLFLMIILFLVKYHWSRRKLYAAASKINGPRGLPLIGNALLFYCKSEDTLHRISSIFHLIDKEPTRLWFGPYLLIGLKNPVHLEKIMSSSKFAYKHELYEIPKTYLGEGLITASGLKPKYKIHRRLLQPMFDLKFMFSTISIIRKQTDICMQKLEFHIDKDTFDILDPIICCSMDIIGETIMGQKMEALQQGLPKFSRSILEIPGVVFKRLTKAWLHIDIIFNILPIKKKSDEIIGITHDFVKNAVIASRQRRKLMKREAGTVFVPIIDTLSEFAENNPNVINHEDLVNHLLTLMTASADTFSIVSSFAVVCFGMYPEYQERAAEEIRSIIGDKPKEITLEDLHRMEYLDMCIKDVLRLFPVAPYIMKRTVDDYTLDKWILPKGAAILIPIFNLHRDPSHWTNPEHFHPDHFLPEAVKKRHIYAYLPFSAGQRGCIGKTMANVLIKMFLASLLQRFQIDADGKVPDLKIYNDLSIRARNGFKCRLRKRN